jgi:5-methyltetrahydrofolate--homocysteine methyltransferase
VPEQSTLALVAHHPQAGYFGMRNGRLLAGGSPDDVIRGTARDPSRFADPGEEDPTEDGAREEARVV